METRMSSAPLPACYRKRPQTSLYSSASRFVRCHASRVSRNRSRRAYQNFLGGLPRSKPKLPDNTLQRLSFLVLAIQQPRPTSVDVLLLGFEHKKEKSLLVDFKFVTKFRSPVPAQTRSDVLDRRSPCQRFSFLIGYRCQIAGRYQIAGRRKAGRHSISSSSSCMTVPTAAQDVFATLTAAVRLLIWSRLYW